MLLLPSRVSEYQHSIVTRIWDLESVAGNSKERRSRHDWPRWEVREDLKAAESVLENRVTEEVRLCGLFVEVECDP